MRNIIITVLMLILPSLAMAQGQVTRKPKPNPVNPMHKQHSVKGPKWCAVCNRLREKERQRIAEQRRKKQEMLTEQKRIIDNLVNNMVYVSGGTFTMGATSEQGCEARDTEKPAHRVTLSSYYIGKYEVTQAEWEAVMGSNPSKFKEDNLPVECVNWNYCQEFIRILNSLTGKNFRLPTEAEWEFAARGGNNSRGYKYSGSNDIGSVAWYDGNSGNKTHPGGQKSPNELGLYDMTGNVLEWCQDKKGDYPSSSLNNPTGPVSGFDRVYRGGSWFDGAERCRISFRHHDMPHGSSDCTGLRLAM